MASPRARWLAGHWKLLFTGWRDLARIASRRPLAGFVIAADLFLRPRLAIYGFLLVSSLCSTISLILGNEGPALLALFALSTGTLVLELGYLRTARRLIGFPPEVPRVSIRDVMAACGVWALAI